jgi:hypothetical protein
MLLSRHLALRTRSLFLPLPVARLQLVATFASLPVRFLSLVIFRLAFTHWPLPLLLLKKFFPLFSFSSPFLLFV